MAGGHVHLTNFRMDLGVPLDQPPGHLIKARGTSIHPFNKRILWTLCFALLSFVGPCLSQSAAWDVNNPTYASSSVHGTLFSANRSLSEGAPTTRQPLTRSTCVEARIRCALRRGCGTALQNYMLECDDLMKGRVIECDKYCKSSLIALTSTEEGMQLMECQCDDEYCRETKKRVEVCREEVVLANARGSVVSCNVAQLICSADAQCATALSFYDRFCKKMFSGRSCSFRCNNSISILARQEKAAKLATCECDGTESFDCSSIKENMARLCFHKINESHIEEEEEKTNEIDTSSGPIKNSSSSGVSHVFFGASSRRGTASFWKKLRAALLNLIPSSVVRWRGSQVTLLCVGAFFYASLDIFPL